MSVVFKETSLPGIILIEPSVFSDSRGYFLETYNQKAYSYYINKSFVQDNHSHSGKGVIRGLHYQLNNPQGKLICVVKGEIFDVGVDIRKGSPTFGKWQGFSLSSYNHKQIYIAEGFAHGFCVLSDEADVTYKCTNLYTPEDEYILNWSDAQIDIDWPVKDPIISEKDNQSPFLKDIPEDLLPSY